MIEALGLICLGALAGFVLAHWHLEDRMEVTEARCRDDVAEAREDARRQEQRADRAIDELAKRVGVAAVSPEAISERRVESARIDHEAKELANFFAEEIGYEDEEGIIPPVPETDPGVSSHARLSA